MDATIGVFGSPPRSSDRICKKMLSIEESLRPNGLARIHVRFVHAAFLLLCARVSDPTPPVASLTRLEKYLDAVFTRQRNRPTEQA